MKIKSGDRVSVLDDDITGVVTRIIDNRYTIETDEGFLFEFTEGQLLRMEDENLMQSPDIFKGFSGKVPSEKPKPKPIERPKRKEIPPMEVDLHIDKLLPSSKGMSNHEILNYQLETAKKKLEFAIRNRIARLVFIHGVGEGVLKVELDFLLGRYENIRFYDANYRKYGVGATEVRILQNAKRI
ncbi:MAG: DNA mismatch repair protein MutS [Bacteroidia bacterium]|nr:DNA mismatch repair protein MutS [Bacteroidia bacterium]